MNNVILKKENGVVSVIEYDPTLFEEESKKKAVHLCWEHCTNACVGQCQKITDYRKKTIDKYDFISDGMQIMDDDGKIDRFLVTGCNNYKKAEQKVQTAEQKRRLKNLRDGLKMAYFDALTLQEANQVQTDLIARGEIVDVRGKLTVEQKKLLEKNRQEKAKTKAKTK